LGILPAHLWTTVGNDAFALNQLNLHAVGAGPYQIAGIAIGADGLPSSITLSPFNQYALGAPKLQKVTLDFYPSEDVLKQAYLAGKIDALGAIPRP